MCGGCDPGAKIDFFKRKTRKEEVEEVEVELRRQGSEEEDLSMEFEQVREWAVSGEVQESALACCLESE